MTESVHQTTWVIQALEPVLRNKGVASVGCNYRKASHSKEDPAQQKKKALISFMDTNC